MTTQTDFYVATDFLLPMPSALSSIYWTAFCPLVSLSPRIIKQHPMLIPLIMNMVALAVTSRMQGETEAPMVPTALTQPNARDSTLEGYSSATQTKNRPHMLASTKRSMPRITISAMTWALIWLSSCSNSRVSTPMMAVKQATSTRQTLRKMLRLTLTTTQLQKIAAKISTKPTRIWSRQTLMPILSKLRMVPSYTNSMIRFMAPQAIVMQNSDLYLNKSIRLYYAPWLGSSSDSESGMNQRSYMQRLSVELMEAILLRECSSYSLPFFNEKLGVSSMTQILQGTISKAGRSMKNPAMIFQLGMNIDSRAIRDTPMENKTCTMRNDLYLILPTSSSFMKVQCRVMAELVPSPMRKLPKPTIAKLPDVTSSVIPTMLIAQAALSVSFLPKLSAMWDMTRQPTKEPMQDMDCSTEASHLLPQSMTVPQSRAIDLGTGCFRCASHSCQVSPHTNCSQVRPGTSSPEVQANSGVMQKKLRENRIMPASIHLSPKFRNSSSWYLGRLVRLLTRQTRVSLQCFSSSILDLSCL